MTAVRGAAAGLCVAIGFVEAAAQATTSSVARGSIADSTGQPISFAQIRIGASGQRVADDSGRFVIPLRETGRLSVEVRRIGFEPVKLSAYFPSDTSLRIQMRPAVASLEAVRIETAGVMRSLELSGFYRRMEQRTKGAGSGHFLPPEDIERRRVTRVTQLLEGTPGVRVTRIGPNNFVILGNTRCPMTVYLNGTRLNRFQGPGWAEIDQIISPTNVAGIEVYARSNAPTEYQLMNGSCGVVLVWTK